MWEDERNTVGGRWLLQLPSAKNNPNVDEYWKNIVRSKEYLYSLILHFIIIITFIFIIF